VNASSRLADEDVYGTDDANSSFNRTRRGTPFAAQTAAGNAIRIVVEKGTRRGTPFATQTAAGNAIRTVVEQGSGEVKEEKETHMQA
nr:ribosomal protein S11, chloroplastic [Tanacetum cinerariifolium]